MDACSNAGDVMAQGRRRGRLEHEGLGGGIRSLFLVSAVTTAATMIMTATTAAHVAWPNAAFYLLAVAIIAAVVIGHARRTAPLRLMFMLGVCAAALPSLMIAMQHRLDHWDDFMTWLPNAVYIWKTGGFPAAAIPVVASDLPGYPPASSLVLSSLWSLAGRVVDEAGPVLNVICLMILPGIALRAIGLQDRQSAVKTFCLGAVLGLAATTLNVGLDWHWVLASLPEVATLVAFAAAFVLAAECLFRKTPDARAGLVALAGILALIANLKQTGIVLVGILLAASAAVAWICPTDDRRSMRDAAVTLALVAIPSVAVWLCWQVYLSEIFTAHSVSFRPLDHWYFPMLPTLMAAIGDAVAAHGLFFVPLAAVVAWGWYVLGRSLLTRGRFAISAGDRLAAIFCLIETGYLAFLVVCYIGAFSDEEVTRAAEFFRYQAEIGAAGLLVAFVLAVERLQQPLFIALTPAILALQLAAVWALTPAAGIYQKQGILTAADVQSIRQLGREAGRLIAESSKEADIELVTFAHPLAVLVMRYEMWARATLQVSSVTVSPADDASEAIADLFSVTRRSAISVALIDGHPLCGFYGDDAVTELLPASKTSEVCLSMLHRLNRHAFELDAASEGVTLR